MDDYNANVLTEAKKGRTGDLELPKGLQIEV